MKAFLLVFLLISIAFTQENVADQAAGILSSMTREAEEKLAEYDALWKENYPLIQSVMDSVQTEFNTLEQECFARKDQIGNTDQEKENTEHYISWIGEKIADNQAKIETLEAAHCESSKLYINGLKHNKLALSLIVFMRKAIQDKESLSLVQRQSLVGYLNMFFQIYQQDELKGIELLQQDYTVDTNQDFTARTDEEIGQDHIDTSGDQIDVQQFESRQNLSWPEYKAQLLALLDTLEQQITQQMANAQEDQIGSGVTLAEWKIKLEAENHTLDRQLHEQVEKISRLDARRVREEASYDVCIDEINILFETLLQTRAEYDDKMYDHEDKRKQLVEEVETLQQIERMYLDHVDGNGKYADREVDQFDMLN